jgi:hypothetical protein
MAGFDDALSDVDLAAWARGEMDYLTGELLEAVDGKHALVVTSRREALDLLLAEGVITVAEARLDVEDTPQNLQAEGTTTMAGSNPNPGPRKPKPPKPNPNPRPR